MIPDEILADMFAEQLERDPSGALARLTLDAVRASDGRRPPVEFVHAGRCGGLVAHAGTVKLPDGTVRWLLVAYNTEFQTAQIIDQPGLNPEAPPLVGVDLADGTTMVTPSASGTRANARSTGVERPNGTVALVVEPVGFPPAPSTFAVRCQECHQAGHIRRSDVARAVGSTPPGRHRIIPVNVATLR